jgi:hypothetical protein
MGKLFYTESGMEVCIQLPDDIKTDDVSDGYHTFGELYDHRTQLFLALMVMCKNMGMVAGWSERHSDGELCFGGGRLLAWIVTPSGQEVRYHIPDTPEVRSSLSYLEHPVGREWNGKEETLPGLASLWDMWDVPAV